MDIVAAIVGGFLAAGTGWFLQTRLESSRLSRARKLLVAGMSDDLRNSIDLYDRIAEDWEKSRIIWFNLVDELFDSRHVYAHNKDWVTVIDDEELRKEIFQYYRKSAQHLLQLRNAQQRKYDIQNRFNLLVQEHRMRNPGIELEPAQAFVAPTMAAENDELHYLEKQIPDLVGGLIRYKSSANQVLEKLRVVKL
jgi:hypothetical protein